MRTTAKILSAFFLVAIIFGFFEGLPEAYRRGWLAVFGSLMALLIIATPCVYALVAMRRGTTKIVKTAFLINVATATLLLIMSAVAFHKFGEHYLVFIALSVVPIINVFVLKNPLNSREHVVGVELALDQTAKKDQIELNRLQSSSKAEVIGFRLMLFVAVSSFLLGSIFSWKSEISAREYQELIFSWNENIREIHKNYSLKARGSRSLDELNQYLAEEEREKDFIMAQQDDLANLRNREMENAEEFQVVGWAVTIAMIVLFYGVRWTLTGRIRPWIPRNPGVGGARDIAKH